MREKAVQFGKSTTLVGILTEPPAGGSTGRKPAVLLLNSGILHRVGSCRFHVQIARALAPLGYTVLRFDYSGIGDSEPRRDNLSFEESAVVETREAMDYLAGKGVTEFVLMGLCSGADMAHETAVADPRVRAMVLLDAWAYKNLGWYLRQYGPKLAHPSAWWNFVRTRWNEAMGKGRSGPPSVAGEGVEYEMPRYVRVFPPRARVAKDLRLFMERGLRLFYIWTGGLWEYNHRRQHQETFRSVRFGDRVRVEHLKEANHILTGLHHQAWVSQRVAEWLEQLYPAGGPLTEAPGARGSDAAGRRTHLSVPVRRSTILGLVVVLLVVVVAEVIAALAIAALGRFDEPIRRTRTIYADQTARIREMIAADTGAALMVDSVLGWRPRPGYRRSGHDISRQGLRATREYTAAPAGALRVAAFGDSFVYGNEVDHPHEWAAVVESASAGVEVLNYGVGGYGTDQALLRFRTSGIALRPRLVLIGFTTDDLSRAVNVYRRFRASDEYPLFKPRFLLGADSSLRLLPPPVASMTDYDALLRDPAAVRGLGAHDWWYEPLIYENPLYDWSATARLASAVFVKARRRLVPGYRLFSGGGFDTSSTAFRLQVRLLDEFARAVREAGAVPVALFLPDRASVDLAREGKPALYARLQASARRLGIPVLDAVDAFTPHAGAAVSGWFAPGGHYSVEGNRIIGLWLGPQLPRLAAPVAP